MSTSQQATGAGAGDSADLLTHNVNQCQCNPNAFRRLKKSTVSTPTSNAINCCCNAASAATSTKGPWLGIDYAEGIRRTNPIPALANKPCILNGKFLFKNAATTKDPLVSCFTNGDGLAGDPGPGCDRPPCGMPVGDPCGDQTLGKVRTFIGSKCESMAMAGTPASNNNVMVRATDELGDPCCAPGEGCSSEKHGEMRSFDRFTCTWRLFTPVYGSDLESQCIDGDGFSQAYGLNLECIAANLGELFEGNEDILEKHGWSQTLA